jgi:hypothetical protein
MKSTHLAVALVCLLAVPLAAQQGDAVNQLLDRLAADLQLLKTEVNKPPIVVPVPTARRLTAADLVYTRSFRLPRTVSNGQAFDFGGSHLALTPGGKTVFVMNRQGSVAEITIPTEAGAFAEYVQGFTDPTEGQRTSRFGDLAAPSGLLVVGQQLVGTVSIYYDAMNSQRVSHYTRPIDLSDRGHVSDFVSVWQADHTGYVAGYLAHVPLEWQAALKGTILTGQFGIPIESRTSDGPAAFAFTLPLTAPLTPATPLVYYPGDHPTLGKWDAANPIYGGTTKGGGLVLVDGTRTALFFGRNGIGTFCYGNGTSDPKLAGTLAADGEGYCVDPSSSDKGQHASPYRYQAWAYDLNDFVAVVTGSKQPWEVVPYDVWELKLPTPEPEFRGIGGAAYDKTSQQLYISQLSADRDGYAYRAMVHVFTVTLR